MRQQGECSAFASLPAASAEAHTLVGQNSDWRLHSFDTVVVLEARQDEGPDFVTVVEAGLLAKTGMNSLRDRRCDERPRDRRRRGRT